MTSADVVGEAAVFTDFCHEAGVETTAKDVVAYHEWAMSPIASKEELSYVSIKENLQYQKMAEREAFNKEYNLKDYEHFGFYGSCGLGIVKPRTEELNIKVYYRLSNLEAGISKKKIANATKKHCLENCISEFGLSNITILGDTLNDKTRDYVNSLKLIKSYYQKY